MTRLVLRLTPLAKAAASVAAIGALAVVYGRLKDASTIGGIGTLLFFGSALVYYYERYRMVKAARAARRENAAQKIGDE